MESISVVSFHVAWTNDKNDAVLLATTSEDTIEVQLPPGDDNGSLVQVFVHIRDSYECVTEYELPEPVVVKPDFPLIERVLNSVQTANRQFLNSTTLDMNCSCTEMLFNDTLHQKLELTKLLSVVKVINEINDELVQRAIDSE